MQGGGLPPPSGMSETPAGQRLAPALQEADLLLCKRNLRKGVSMKNLLQNLANLVKVKTMVTFTVMVVFTVLALRGSISPDNAMIIISMVVSFYFGTQQGK